MRVLVVTGAARGIGNTIVKRALARGETVIACVRKLEDQDKFPTSENLYLVAMDVSNTESVRSGFKSIDKLLLNRKLDAVVHCAAISTPGLIESTPIEEVEAHLNTNTLGSLRVMQESIPRLRGHGGRLILTTSLWGRAAGPVLGAYCASKHAVECMADVARRETIGMDLHIVVAEPGVVLTDMYSTQNDAVDGLIGRLPDSLLPLYNNFLNNYKKVVASGGGAAITADKAAENYEKILNASKPKARYQFGVDSKIVCLMTALIPTGLMDKLLAMKMNHKP